MKLYCALPFPEQPPTPGPRALDRYKHQDVQAFCVAGNTGQFDTLLAIWKSFHRFCAIRVQALGCKLLRQAVWRTSCQHLPGVWLPPSECLFPEPCPGKWRPLLEPAAHMIILEAWEVVSTGMRCLHGLQQGRLILGAVKRNPD